MNGALPLVTPASLRAQRLLPARFQLALPGREPLVAEQIYRYLPGRRIVFRAQVGRETLLIKLFFRYRDFRRECAGLDRLPAQGVPSPEVRWRHREPHAWLLATEFLEGAYSLAGRLDTVDAKPVDVKPVDANAVDANAVDANAVDVDAVDVDAVDVDAVDVEAGAGAVLALLGALHRAGLVQRDAHLDNFLIRDGVAHAIDGAGIRRARGARALRANLALLLAQFPPAWDARLRSLLGRYGDPGDHGVLRREWRRARGRRLRAYRRKCVRSCGEFVVDRAWRHFTARRRDRSDEGFLGLLANPEPKVAGAPRLKDGNSATVVRIADTDSDLILKRYNVKDWRHALRRAPRRSRAWVSWQNANTLAHLGVPTPRVLGLREGRWGPLRWVTYLLSEASAGMPLQEWMEVRGARPVPAWLDLALLDILATLTAVGLSHGDLKASNFLVEEARQRLLLIDLDAMRLHRCARRAQRALRRDRERFLANWDGELRGHFAQLLAPLEVLTPRRRQEP